MKRKSLSKKVRFDVFKRDSFTCQYCGSTPPAVVLEIDHINPVSKGGDNAIDNLLTSCFDCNRGKRDGLLNDIPDTLKQKQLVISEREDQIKEYNKVLKAKKRRQNKTIMKIQEAFKEHYETLVFTESFRESIRYQFMPYIPEEQLVSAMFKAVDKTRYSNDAIKYFCGICWNMRRTIEGEE